MKLYKVNTNTSTEPILYSLVLSFDFITAHSPLTTEALCDFAQVYYLALRD